MTKEIKTNTGANAETTYHGMTLDEHRELGHGLYMVLTSLEKMADRAETRETGERFEHMLDSVDLVLHELHEHFEAAYADVHGVNPRRVCVEPYPSVGVVGGRMVYLVHGEDGRAYYIDYLHHGEQPDEAAERSKEWHETAVLDYGMAD